MALELPATLSPSKVSSFTDCALAFRYSAIDRLPEPPSLPAVKGTLVHAALEALFVAPRERRTRDFAHDALEYEAALLAQTQEWADLSLGAQEADDFYHHASLLLDNYFHLEDPTRFEPIGVELKLEINLDGLRLRGIIDRLDLDPDGNLVVTDYKSGKAPPERNERARLSGVHFYSLMCERLFGVRPAKVRLLYLGDPLILEATPSEQSTNGLVRKVGAVWTAIETACEREDFRPRTGPLCNWCSFRDRCPAIAAKEAVASSS